MTERKSKLDHSLDLIHRIMAWLAAASIIFMMLAISYSVIMRYVWAKPVPWIVEVTSYLMLYITFLGTAWLQRQGGHVEVDLFLGNMTPRRRASFKAITYIGGALVGFVLAWKGSLITIDYFHRGVTVIGILNTPQFLLTAIIPVGGFLLLVEFLLQIWRFASTAVGRERPSE